MRRACGMVFRLAIVTCFVTRRPGPLADTGWTRTSVRLTAEAPTPPKDKIIYTHCVVGKRSVAAGNILEKLGYQVRPIKPGYRELIAAGFTSEQ